MALNHGLIHSKWHFLSLFSLLFNTGPRSKKFAGLFTSRPFCACNQPLYLIMRPMMEPCPSEFIILALFQSNSSWSTYIISISISNSWDLISHWLDHPFSFGGFNEINDHDLIFSWDGRSLFISTFWDSNILWVTQLPLSPNLVHDVVNYFHTTLIWKLTRFLGFDNLGL